MIKSKSGFIAIVGYPNVGKSTLLNSFIGEKITIISSKPQTTRNNIMGILTKGHIQIVFIDTPGIHKPHTKLSEHMVNSINQSIGDVDAAIFVVEPLRELKEQELKLLQSLKDAKLPVILAINKIDTVDDKDKILKSIDYFSKLHNFVAIIPISALTTDGTDLLLDKAMELCNEGPHFFPDDEITDQPERVIVSEIIREKILELMYDEIPHGIAVDIEKLHERHNKNLVDIEATIYCEKMSHKGMIIGKGGSMLKKISMKSRQDIEDFLGVKVNLQCWVKVKDDWRNNERIIKSFGFTER